MQKVEKMGLFGVIETIVIHISIDYVYSLLDKCVNVDYAF